MSEIVKRENLMKFKIVVNFEKKFIDRLCNVNLRNRIVNYFFKYV